MPHQNPSLGVGVYSGTDLIVRIGANHREPLGVAALLVQDDIYTLHKGASLQRLSCAKASRKQLTITNGSTVGVPGRTLSIDCKLTFMAPDAQVVEALLLTGDNGDTTTVVLPFDTFLQGTDYRLVGVDREADVSVLAGITVSSFARGTRISLPSGQLCAIENITAGDLVLTRDDGPQCVRWIGHTTQRAVGLGAPIRVRAGALNNAEDLYLSPDHRLLIYQRSDQLNAGKEAIVVNAKDLIDGDSITRADGGFVEYYQILFDRHHMIFAEGIAAESTLSSAFFADLLPERFKRENQLDDCAQCHAGLDIPVSKTNHATAAELLRHASKGNNA